MGGWSNQPVKRNRYMIGLHAVSFILLPPRTADLAPVTLEFLQPGDVIIQDDRPSVNGAKKMGCFFGRQLAGINSVAVRHLLPPGVS